MLSRGGPAEMLKVSQPTLLAEGVTVSPARLQLEILAIYETFGGCYTPERVGGRRVLTKQDASLLARNRR
jgi:hypothetical protein